MGNRVNTPYINVQEERGPTLDVSALMSGAYVELQITRTIVGFESKNGYREAAAKQSREQRSNRLAEQQGF